MPAATGNKFTDTFNSANPNSARVTVGRTAGASSLTCDNLAGWPTVSKVHFATYKIDTNNAKVAGSQIDWYGIVSGNSIGSMTRLAGATDAGNAIGDVVEMMPTGSWGHDLYTGLTLEHNQDGTHGALTSTNATLTTPTLTTPIISNFSSATHDHSAASKGGTLNGATALQANSVTPAQMLGIDMFGVGAAVSGSAPSAGTGQFYIQAGTTVGAFANNALDVAFPTAFPNGVLTVVCINGDASTGAGMSVTNSNISASGFRAQSGTVSGTQRVDWIAIGF